MPYASDLGLVLRLQLLQRRQAATVGIHPPDPESPPCVQMILAELWVVGSVAAQRIRKAELEKERGLEAKG